MCKRCGRSIDIHDLNEFINDEIAHVDTLGVESLTDARQAVYEGALCPSCYREEDV